MSNCQSIVRGRARFEITVIPSILSYITVVLLTIYMKLRIFVSVPWSNYRIPRKIYQITVSPPKKLSNTEYRNIARPLHLLCEIILISETVIDGDFHTLHMIESWRWCVLNGLNQTSSLIRAQMPIMHTHQLLRGSYKGRYLSSIKGTKVMSILNKFILLHFDWSSHIGSCSCCSDFEVL